MDCDHINAAGYPTEAFLDLLRTSQDGLACLEIAAEYFNSGYGRAFRDVVACELYKFATGGWSGCEDVIEALMANGFVNLMWESHHRGGLWVFDVSRAIAVKQDVSAAGAKEE
jgi:hypothetical protein